MESRRSHTNLSYLTLSPISTRLPIDSSPTDEPEVPAPWSQRTSYIAGKSAPTTPRILSRSPSQTRLGQYTSSKLASSKSFTHLPYADTEASANGLTKSKSTGQALYLGGALGPRKKRKAGKATGSTDDDEWLLRTGAGISTETRESKGQSWLVSRESSTSLVVQGEDDEDDIPQYRPATPRSARTSRHPSRMTSARQSRRGSRVGSRADLTHFATPAGARTPGSAKGPHDLQDYFGETQAEPAGIVGPDFVDEADFEEEDQTDGEEEQQRQEDELRKLTNVKGVGFGGLVDRLLNWNLLDESNDSEDERQSSTAQRVSGRTAPAKNVISTPASKESNTQTDAGRPTSPAKGEEQHGWADAAWLLSVASKVLL